jgi:hypothetical protein
MRFGIYIGCFCNSICSLTRLSNLSDKIEHIDLFYCNNIYAVIIKLNLNT